MSGEPRYQSLRDYLRVLRAHRLLILLFVVVFGAGAYGVSKLQDRSYSASAFLSFEDPNNDLSLIDAPTRTIGETPDQRAAAGAELVTQLEVARGVQRALRSPRSPKKLQDKVSAHAQPKSNFVVVEASDGSARYAARLANEFARQASRLAARQERGRFAAAARSQRRQLTGTPNGRNPLVRGLALERISRLKAAAQFAQPVQIAQAAEVPDSPSSPKPVRNTIIGLLLGLTLGIMASFVRDSLDVRLRGSNAIQTELGLPVLGHVGDKALGKVAGNGQRGLSAEDLETFRILRTNLDLLQGDKELRSILVTSPVADEGKSTVAIALALLYAAAGKRVLLVECDLRRPVLSERLGVAAAPGLTDYLLGDTGPQEILQEVPLNHPLLAPEGSSNGRGGEAPEPRMVCISSGRRAWRPAELLGGTRFREFIAEVSEAYDVVILDSSPILSVADTLEIMSFVDGVLLCVRAARTTRDAARAARTAIERIPPRPTGLVVTGVRKGEESQYGYYAHAYGEAPAPS